MQTSTEKRKRQIQDEEEEDVAPETPPLLKRTRTDSHGFLCSPASTPGSTHDSAGKTCSGHTASPVDDLVASPVTLLSAARHLQLGSMDTPAEDKTELKPGDEHFPLESLSDKDFNRHFSTIADNVYSFGKPYLIELIKRARATMPTHA